ncbi:DUF4012 domain-containing protein [uncultured Schumannella sp.]|uniref:DUF4012 domain-containing protein n=1 Tax=uncultured Schumannella sp. TaxID=1195956 RepID=UPI0025F08596|nr:DUF4012 domain-containing protein [uncultured Schumannella sp.]
MDSLPGYRQPRLSGARRWVRTFAGALAIVALSLSAWIGVRAFIAYDALVNAQSRIGDITSSLASLNFLTLPVAIEEIDHDLGVARSMMSDPIWQALESAPVVGGSLASVHELTAALDDFVGDGLLPLANDAQDLSLDALRPNDGQIDLEAIETLVAAAGSATGGLHELRARIEAIDQTAALGPVRGVITRLLAQVVSADESALRAVGVLQLIEPAIGLEGQRGYAVVLLDSGVDTAIGGQALGVLEVTMSAGAIDVSAPMTAAEAGLDTPQFRELERSPGFPAYAREASLALGSVWGRDVDAVLAIDLVGLAYLLDATGPITTSNGTLLSGESLRETADGASSVDGGDATAVLEVTVSAVVAGEGASRGFLASAVALRDERRLKMWSSDAVEQEALASTSLSGDFAVVDAASTSFGVFVVDHAEAQLRTPVSVGIELLSQGCASEQQLVISLDAGTLAVERDLIVLGPIGGEISELGGADSVTLGQPTVEGRDAATAHVRIDPRGHAVVTVSFAGAAEDDVESSVVTNARIVPTEVVRLPCP